MDERRAKALEKIATLAAAMRVEQRAWFGGDKSQERLRKSRVAEKALDAALAELDAPQGKLFG